jgi:uncharacterized 2Fe-2S/4Fe-4S cluster protein (DUF4445 family)
MQIRVPSQALLAYEPQVLSDYRINVPFAHDPLLGLDGLGVAVDVGTTTVVVSLLNLRDGRVVGRAAGFNRQMHLGDDVLTRINLCLTDPAALGRLQTSIIDETVKPLLDAALIDANVSSSDVRGYVIAGNTTMLHLVAGEDPGTIGYAPFTPRFLHHLCRSSSEIGLPGDVSVHLLPGAASYVGADITCGVFASGLIYDQGPSLLVDVGTNGEIVLKLGERLFGCATAAGPAFEGSGLSCGVRAGDGAIAHLAMEETPLKVNFDVIGPPGTKPAGLCGSAYIDFLAASRSIGLLTRSGRFCADSVEGGEELVAKGEHGLVMTTAIGQGKRPIFISESDVAKLLQAKAAIAAGILTLLNRVELTPEAVSTLYLAGGFGMHLDLANAIACGLLPGFRPDQIQLVGNSSLAGATISTLDRSVVNELEAIGRKMEIVELNLDPDFEDTYIDQLSLP